MSQGGAEQVAARVEGVGFAGGEDLAVRRGLGEGVHFGDKRDGALNSDPLSVAALIERHGRHGSVSRKVGRRPAS